MIDILLSAREALLVANAERGDETYGTREGKLAMVAVDLCGADTQPKSRALNVLERFVDVQADWLDERRQRAQDRGRLGFRDVPRRARIEVQANRVGAELRRH